MSFVVVAALAIALFAIAPVVAHLLRRGRADEREFPPAALVPSAPPIARRRSHIEDRALLGVRAAMVVLLAMLGAIPLVRCSRLSLGRHAGASVAMAVVIDDSLSMRAARPGSASRFVQALEGARQIVGAARDGDVVAIVLAGAPARLALAATRDIATARRALDQIEPSDRSTDLEGAVKLGRSAILQLPHADKRVVLLSDLAAPPLPRGEPPLWMPLDALRAPVANCGIAFASQRGDRVEVVVACNDANAARGRRVEVVAAESFASTPAGTGALEPRDGEQRLSIDARAATDPLDARLTGADGLVQDDTAPVAAKSAGLHVALVADPATASPATGGATVIEQALAALDRDVVARPLLAPPEEASSLAGQVALVIDDPTGLGPEARATLEEFVQKGGVLLGLLGPRAAAAPLGTSLEPFAVGGVRWEETAPKGADEGSAAWLGEAARGLEDLAARGRARLDVAAPPGATVTARWQDGLPLFLERPLGRGLVVSVGLPAAPTASDLALRPAFLALLDRVVEQAASKSGAEIQLAGEPWSFPGKGRLSITGPDGPLEPAASSTGSRTLWPVSHGRYRIDLDGEVQTRVVAVDAAEIVATPRTPDNRSTAAAAGGEPDRVDASREIALALLALLAAEIGLRVALGARQRDRGSRGRASEPLAGGSGP